MSADDMLLALGRDTDPPSRVDAGADAEAALQRLRTLSEAFERLACPTTQASLLELEAIVATALNRAQEAGLARAHRVVLDAVRAHVDGDSTQAAALMWQAEAEYRRWGDGRRRFHAQSMALRFQLVAAPDDPEPVAAAVAALPGLRPAQDGEAVLEFARRLAADIAAVPVRAESAQFFAGCASIAAQAGAAGVQLTMQARLGGALVALGLPELALGPLTESERQLRRYAIVGSAGQPEPPPEAVEAAYWTARAFDRIGRSDDAERGYRGHPWLTDDGDLGAEVRTRLVELIAGQGRSEEALRLLESPATAVGPSYAALVAALQAQIHARLGRTATAAVSADAAQTALARVGVEGSAGAGLHAAGRAAAARARIWLAEYCLSGPGDLDRADHWLDEASATIGALGGDAEPFRLDRVCAAVLTARGQHRAAVDRLTAAVEAEIDVTTIDLTGIVAEGPVAAWSAVQAVELRAARESRGVGVELRGRLAAARVAAGDGDEAELDAAIALAAQRNRHELHCDVLVAKAHWLGAAGRTAQALDCLDAAVDVLEGMRSQLSDGELQVTALASREVVYGVRLEASLAVGEAPPAQLATMEQAKGRALLNVLPPDEGPSVALPGHAERLLLASRRERHELLQELRRRFAEHDPGTAGLEAAGGRLALAYRRAHPSSAAARRAAASIEQLRGLGSQGRVLVHYFRTARSFLVAVVAGGEVLPIVELADCSATKVADLLDGFAFEREVLSPARSLAELYRLLVAPYEEWLERADSLLVIPHDVLHAVPFHALVDANGRHLIERLAVSYASSGAIALHSQRLAARSAVTAPPRSLGFAVDSVPYVPMAAIGASAELSAVMSAVEGLEPHVGEDARRATLFTRSGPLDVLHLACHGEFDPADPLLSRLYLADGPVYGYEISALAIAARMVVLSACESGIQTRYPGDEMYGLVRAFVAAGAAGVVSSLWAVPDESSARIMTEFYRSWRVEGSSPAEALRAAQLHLLRSATHQHPRFWAPYVLIGA